MDSNLALASIALFTAVVSYLAPFRLEPATQKKGCGPSLIFIAAALTWYASWQNFLISQERTWQQAEDQFRTDWLQRKQLSERLKYERELRAKTEEIASLNREIVAITTGGDSYAFLLFSLGDGKTNEPVLGLHHKGKFPLYDVSVEVTDSEKFEAIVKALGLPQAIVPVTPEQLREINKAKVTFPPVNLRPNQGLTLRNQWALASDRDRIRYSIAIFARNGTLSQQITLSRISGFWRQAGRVFRDTGFEKPKLLLYEWADPQFPRDKRGKPIW